MWFSIERESEDVYGTWRGVMMEIIRVGEVVCLYGLVNSLREMREMASGMYLAIMLKEVL